MCISSVSGHFSLVVGCFISKPCGLHELKQFAHTSPALFRCCARAQPPKFKIEVQNP
jgi:hypothetical protein